MPLLASANDTVCATVKIEIKQELTLERQAFEAHMRINNGLDTMPLENVSILVLFTDENGQQVRASTNPDSTDAKFFIRIDALENIDSIEGGRIAPGVSADIRWLIIPAPGAANDIPTGTLYFVGATLDYLVGGKEERVEVAPDSIYVKPMPQLTLDYFLPRDVHGDDAFTPEIEPSEPFTLGVRILNNGKGEARSVNIDSAQPKIVENEQGLLIGFEILGGSVNDQPSAPSLLLEFGDIAPSGAATGRWDMITSLSGKFIDFKAEFTHADELGGALTSLLEATNAHWLIHDVLVDLPGQDQVRDFLADDGDTIRVYNSNGTEDEVAVHSEASRLEFVVQTGSHQYFELHTPPEAGFMYVQLPDPSRGNRAITSVSRSDGKTLASPNFWSSRVRAADKRSWNHYINVFDVASTGTYTVVMEPWEHAPQPPAMQFIPDRATYEGGQLSFLVQASDPQDNAVILTAHPLPAGSDFIDQGDGTGIFTWYPEVGQAGVHEIVFTASSGELASVRRPQITVNPWWDPDGEGKEPPDEGEEPGDDEDGDEPDPVAGFAAEMGVAEISGEWSSVALQGDFEQPLLLLGAASSHAAEAGVVRTRNLGVAGFEVRFQRWLDPEVEHGQEAVPYLVLEPGRYQLFDGSIWEVGVIELAKPNDWNTIRFGRAFTERPEVFLTLQTSAGDRPALVRARHLTPAGFEAALFTDAVLDDESPDWPLERVAYLAVQKPGAAGTVVFDGASRSYELTTLRTDENSIDFADSRLLLQRLDENESPVPERLSALSLGGSLFAQLTSDASEALIALRRGEPGEDPDQVAAPRFSLAAGGYTSAQSVLLSSTTPAAQIRYTLDGSEPTEESALYTTPISLPLDATTTITARAFGEGLAASAIASATYHIYSPPQLALPAEFIDGVAQIEAGGTSTFHLEGGSGDYLVQVRPNASGVEAGVLVNADGSYTFIAPDQGAFAGRYELAIIDQQTGWTDVITVVVPLDVVLSHDRLLGKVGVAELRIRGAQAGDALALQVHDAAGLPDLAGAIATIDSPAIAQDDHVAANPATAQLRAADVAQLIRFQVKVTPELTHLYDQAYSPTAQVEPAVDYLGKVQADSGAPLAQAKVRVADLADGEGHSYAALTNAEGVFELIAPATGSELHWLLIDAVGYLPAKVAALDCLRRASEPGCTIPLVQSLGGQAEQPTLSLAGGLFTGPQRVKLSSRTPDALIRYTLDGSMPSRHHGEEIANGAIIVISQNSTLTAIAYTPQLADSKPRVAQYRIRAARPAISPSGGSHSAPVSVTIRSDSAQATIRYTTDGSNPSAEHGLELANGGSFQLRKTGIVKAVAVHANMEVSLPSITTVHVRPSLKPEEPGEDEGGGLRDVICRLIPFLCR